MPSLSELAAAAVAPNAATINDGTASTTTTYSSTKVDEQIDAAFDLAIGAATSALDTLGEAETRIVAAETAATALTTRVTSAETAATALTTRVTSAETAATTLTGRVTAAETAATSLDGRVTAAESAATTLTTRVTNAETAATSLTTRVTTAETSLATLDYVPDQPGADDLYKLRRAAGAHSWEIDTSPQMVVLTADSPNNTTTTLVNTALAFPVVAGGTYWFRCFYAFNSSATTTGVRVVPNGPAFTRLRHTCQRSNGSATAQIFHGQAAWQLPATASGTSPTGGGEGTMEGVVSITAAGSITIQIASEVAASAIARLAGSNIQWRRITGHGNDPQFILRHQHAPGACA